MRTIIKKTVLFSIALALFLPGFSYSQEDLSKTCEISAIESSCKTLSSADCRKLLEKCESYYANLSSEIAEDLSKTGEEKKTLQSKISSLQKKIQNLNYQIKQSNLIITDLTIQIGDTELSIEKTNEKIEEQKKNLSAVLRQINEEDQRPIVEIMFAEDNLSGFFDNVVALERLNLKGKEFLSTIKMLKGNLEGQKTSLDEEKGDLERMVEIQTLQKQESDKAKKEQEQYLKLTEQEYQKYLSQKQEVDKKASEIRARIFDLIGVSKAPTFGEAYEIAKQVEQLTGVRPAFLLAILTQESNLGKNVGQCYLKDPATGSGIVIKSGKVVSKVMSPTNDIKHFLTITQELGRDPYATPVSCPMSYGWGGAMGPAQFIPRTWIIYRERLAEINGKPADPWNIRDAFLAAGLYLSGYGAKKQNYEGELNAALSYFAGPGWYQSKNKNVYLRDYGYPVMALTKQYEADIQKIK
ncbi:MAG: hypothetical protein A2365_03465 [Candidatus Nealsonbacteria bacterium RIFOXYB1_FULL_40_15]|uniref:Transglycosylase SLT domain-containing protein n=2 Tax=Candidatus Nealsoniibacteriota TaxID=1817911 RepID=A0A1G2ERF6_9BACT|nr:MAG: hypothetical protein A2365_03465 [Candidatus Nealsonbacteria bacterium RIFOXYB1_FULL_40_15]OGZ28363.1 MAG: hypothetical protein A2427_01145 [Candidatus Nealsonbacteria bacterium RIFOXYC1_FULL_40_7]OGZ29488.1 MAG: hypothetical protein A2562_02240 [Candidatus Nealsonbacteria bacterium RIFOXYD1_FULL_39_11]